MTKKVLTLILVMVLIASMLSGCGSKSSSSEPAKKPDKTFTIRVAHVLNTDHASHITLEQVFKKEVEEKSKGRIKVEIYPNAQLGSDRQTLEAASIGSLEMSAAGGSVLTGFDEDFSVLELPFLFKTKQEASKAFDGEFGKTLNEGLKVKNLMNLGFGQNGYRHITNSSKPITKPEDLKGMKIRTMENPIHIATFKAFGANPTPMAFGELFTALQQKTVDAQENPTNIVYTSKFYEVQKYMSLTGHLYASVVYVMSKSFYDSLPEDLQKIVAEAVTHTVQKQRELTDKQEGEFLEKLKQSGMVINELTPEQKEAFIQAAAPVYDEFRKKDTKGLLDLLKKSVQ